MADPTDKKRLREIEAQLMLMGWRRVVVPGGHRWQKYYPPPQEVERGSSRLKIIGRQNDPVWDIDVRRALLLRATPG